jgi:hypothetical protein
MSYTGQLLRINGLDGKKGPPDTRIIAGKSGKNSDFANKACTDALFLSSQSSMKGFSYNR